MSRQPGDHAGGHPFPVQHRVQRRRLSHGRRSKVLCRTAIPILSPREYYERVGDVGNVVFSCGAVLEDGDRLRIYYGGADTSICVGSARLGELMQFCRLDDHGM